MHAPRSTITLPPHLRNSGRARTVQRGAAAAEAKGQDFWRNSLFKQRISVHRKWSGRPIDSSYAAPNQPIIPTITLHSCHLSHFDVDHFVEIAVKQDLIVAVFVA